MTSQSPAPTAHGAHPWMTAPDLGRLTAEDLGHLRHVKRRLARKHTLRSWWYRCLKATCIFYALIISNIRVICGPSSDWVFSLLNVFALVFLVLDFCLLWTIRRSYLSSLAAWVYLLAILFTFFDFSFFTVRGFQAVEFTVYFKLLFLIDPMFFQNAWLASLLSGVWNALTRKCGQKKTEDDETEFVGYLGNLSKINSEKRTLDKTRRDFVRDAVAAAAHAPPHHDPLVAEKKQLFSDFFCRQGKQVLNSPTEALGSAATLQKGAQSSAKVIKRMVRLQLIVWQIVICLVLLCFYPNWVKFSLGYTGLQNVLSFEAKYVCDSPDTIANVQNLLVHNSLEHTEVLYVNISRVTTGPTFSSVLQVLSAPDAPSIPSILQDYRPYELLTIDSSAELGGMLPGQCYLSSVLNNRRYFQMIGLMNILRAIVVLILINIYYQLFAERTIRNSSEAFNLGLDFCRLIKLNISRGGSLAWQKYNEHQNRLKNRRKKGGESSNVWKNWQASGAEEPVASANRKLIQTAAFLKSGFGEAGIEFLRSFLADERNNNAFEVDCVISFVEIREFDGVVQRLGTAIVDLVSEVAETISRKIEKGGGFSNKNSEAYFLLIWRCKGDNRQKVSQDAFYSLVDAFHDLTRRARGLTNGEFRQKRRFPGGLGDLEGLATPEASPEPEPTDDLPLNLSLGIGVHFGRVTEGGVGSKFKIDISYLSPQVNLASRVQSVTKQFGLRFLLSGKFKANLGLDYAELLRPVDRVFLKGSAEEVELFTYDGILHGFLTEERGNKWADVDFEDEGAKIRNLQACLGEDYPMFSEVWMHGYQMYLGGKFAEAAQALQLAHAQCSPFGDRSAQTLLDYIAGMTPEARRNWKGARKLEQK